MKAEVSFAAELEKLTEAVTDQVPKLVWGEAGSGEGNLNWAEAIPVPLVMPCLTAITEPFEFCMVKRTFWLLIEMLLFLTEAYICSVCSGPYSPPFALEPAPPLSV